MREELDTDVDVAGLVFHTTHAYPDRTVALYFYRCALKGTPTPLLGQEMRWAGRAELPTLGFPPADEELIQLLVAGGGCGVVVGHGAPCPYSMRAIWSRRRLEKASCVRPGTVAA